MPLDMEEYAEAMDEFLLGMERVDQLVHPDITKSLRRICGVLRIAKIHVELYDTMLQAEKGSDGRSVVFYQEEGADESRCFFKREVTGGQNVVDYRVFQRAGDADWSEAELGKVRTLIKMLYVFNGRTRVMQIAENLTFRDPALDIYNLNFFMRSVNVMIAKQQQGAYAACFFNLKRFFIINQTIGRINGDIVMKRYALGLQDLLGEEGIVCRVGGDNFITLFRRACLDDVRSYLSDREVVYDDATGDSVSMSAKAGCYIISEGARSATDVMDRVSYAFQASRQARNENFVFFNEKLLQSVEETKQVEIQFEDAIRNGEFQVYYQPKVFLRDYCLAGAEALCRWKRDGRLLPPATFIPVLERNRAICILDFYMLEHVCRDIRGWLDEGRPVVQVSVNLSRCHLGDSKLLSRILGTIDRYRVPHEYIQIELTETTTDVDFRDLREIVEGLKEAGIATAVDDFGVGYSSLNLLREMPWSVLKIDKSFLDAYGEKGDSGSVMLRHVIAMAREIGLECIAEGVETPQHVQMLKENNCFMAQGYYFDRPLEKGEFEERMEMLSRAEQRQAMGVL